MGFWCACTLRNFFNLRQTLFYTTHLQLFGREMLINHNDVFHNRFIENLTWVIKCFQWELSVISPSYCMIVPVKVWSMWLRYVCLRAILSNSLPLDLGFLLGRWLAWGSRRTFIPIIYLHVVKPGFYYCAPLGKARSINSCWTILKHVSGQIYEV